MMRVGNLVFYSIGQLWPDRIESFHNTDFIYPVSYLDIFIRKKN
jgi:hypothetical protein